MEFVHYSKASYLVDAMRIGNDIFLLCEVTNYVTPYHLRGYIVPFGIKDIDNGGVRVYFEKPEEYHSNSNMGISIRLTEERLEIIDDEGTHLYCENVYKLKESRPNPKFFSLYEDYDYGLDSRKLVLRGMIT